MDDRRKQILDELQELSPLLHGLRSKVPDPSDAYVLELEQEVLREVKEIEPSPKIRPLHWITTIAAGLAILLVSMQYFQGSEVVSDPIFDMVEVEALHYYIDEEIDDFLLDDFLATADLMSDTYEEDGSLDLDDPLINYLELQINDLEELLYLD